MKSVFAIVALAALCATALTAVSDGAYAGTVTITGTPLAIGPIPLYGSAIGENNVVNSAGAPLTGSILNDPNGATFPTATPWVQQGQVEANVGNNPYVVTWFFAGSESGYGITLTTPSHGTVNFTEGNQNNSYGAGGPALKSISFQELGTSSYAAGDPLSFKLSWSAGSVDNSAVQNLPKNGGANLIFSYLDPSSLGDSPYMNLVSGGGDWFVFALNDSGGNDEDHDDFVGFAQITAQPGAAGLAPIPAALPLFGSVLGGGIFLGKWRKRRKQQA